MLKTKKKINHFVHSVIVSNTSSIATSQNGDSIFFETNRPGPWSEILENWIVSEKLNLNARNSRVMKFGDKTLTISQKLSSPNKREVSETDLYLLGKFDYFQILINYSEFDITSSKCLFFGQ